MQLPLATEALLELVRHDAVSRPSDRLGEMLASGSARLELHRLAARHAVMGPVLCGLRAATARDPVLASRCSALLAQYPLIIRQAAMWDLEIGRILRLLEGARLQPVTLKGAALRASVYQNSVERSFGDLDLLLEPPELDRALALLQAAGYALGDAETVQRSVEGHFHHRLTNPMGFQVELHWALTPPHAEVRLSPERILSRSRLLERFGEEAPMRIPSPEDMVLHLATQETEDWFSTIRRQVDLDRVVRRSAGFDWSYLRSAAAESRMGPLLGFTLQLTRRLLSTPIPPAFIASLGLSRGALYNLELLEPEKFVLTSYAQRRPTSVRVLALCLSLDRGSRMRLLREMATGRFDLFSPEHPERTASKARGMVGLAKVALLWTGLYLRRGVAAIPRSTRKQMSFWREET